jgi:RimJ/RimL family protein N-acetyltransferase
VRNELDAGNESCGFEVLLPGPRSYGRGLGTQASRLVLEHAFGRRRPFAPPRASDVPFA